MVVETGIGESTVVVTTNEMSNYDQDIKYLIENLDRYENFPKPGITFR